MKYCPKCASSEPVVQVDPICSSDESRRFVELGKGRQRRSIYIWTAGVLGAFVVFANAPKISAFCRTVRYRHALNHSMAPKEDTRTREAMVEAFESMSQENQKRVMDGLGCKYAVMSEIVVSNVVNIGHAVEKWKSDSVVEKVVKAYREGHPASMQTDEILVRCLRSAEFIPVANLSENRQVIELLVHGDKEEEATSLANYYAECLESADAQVRAGRPALAFGGDTRIYKLPFKTCVDCGGSAFHNKRRCVSCQTEFKW